MHILPSLSIKINKRGDSLPLINIMILNFIQNAKLPMKNCLKGKLPKGERSEVNSSKEQGFKEMEYIYLHLMEDWKFEISKYYLK